MADSEMNEDIPTYLDIPILAHLVSKVEQNAPGASANAAQAILSYYFPPTSHFSVSLTRQRSEGLLINIRYLDPASNPLTTSPSLYISGEVKRHAHPVVDDTSFTRFNSSEPLCSWAILMYGMEVSFGGPAVEFFEPGGGVSPIDHLCEPEGERWRLHLREDVGIIHEILCFFGREPEQYL
ncbi:hypothetical protein FQN54_000887 [Arachnomyces sp. PD_36]|nr:hypothetical protein FQN54_000887 [Arachnomyces sp. PD_36]